MLLKIKCQLVLIFIIHKYKSKAHTKRNNYVDTLDQKIRY